MVATLFMAFSMGLLNTVHCWGMCGGIVAALHGMGKPGEPRLAFAYNLGRMGSYAALGGLAGAVFALDATAGSARFLWLQALGCLALVLAGLRLAELPLSFGTLERLARPAWQVLGAQTRRLLPLDSAPRALLAGALWGLLPCGLVYSMLAVSAGTGAAWRGALAMTAFGLGTQPGMLAASLLAGRVGALRLAPGWRRGVGLAVIASALLWFGLQRLPLQHDGQTHHHHATPHP